MKITLQLKTKLTAFWGLRGEGKKNKRELGNQVSHGREGTDADRVISMQHQVSAHLFFMAAE